MQSKRGPPYLSSSSALAHNPLKILGLHGVGSAI
jgi:hypothetical protein